MVTVAEAFVTIRPDMGRFGAELNSASGPIKRLGDDASHAFDGATKKVGGFGDALRGVGQIAGGFIAANVVAGAAAKIAGFVGDSLEHASDLNEALNKSNVVFKDNAKEIEDWAATGAKAFGLSKREALGAAGSLGNMFDQLGFGGEQATGMSKSIVELAADFGSFHNADISDVLLAQSAAFRGEYDSLQRFLPLINAATVDQKAMALTGKATTKELTAQEKALAVYTLMLEGAGEARGDFARTSKDNANASRIERANYENLQATLGQKLLPIQLAITRAKIALVDVLVTKVIPVVEELYAKHWPAISKAINEVVAVIKENWPTISAVIGFVFDFVKTKIEGFIQTVGAIIEIVTSVVNLVSDLFHGRWSEAWQEMKDIAGAIVDLLIGQLKMQFGNIPGLILDVLAAIPGLLLKLGAEIISGLISGITSLLGNLDNVVAGIGTSIVNAFAGAATWLFDAGKRIVSGLWTGIKDGVTAVYDFFRGIGTEIADSFKDAARWLYNAGRAIIGGLWDGMKDKAGGLLDWVDNLASRIESAVRDPLKVFSPSRVMVAIGQDIMGGLATGISTGFRRTVEPTLTDATNDILQLLESFYAAGVSPEERDAGLKQIFGMTAGELERKFGGDRPREDLFRQALGMPFTGEKLPARQGTIVAAATSIENAAESIKDAGEGIPDQFGGFLEVLGLLFEKFLKDFTEALDGFIEQFKEKGEEAGAGQEPKRSAWVEFWDKENAKAAGTAFREVSDSIKSVEFSAITAKPAIESLGTTVLAQAAPAKVAIAEIAVAMEQPAAVAEATSERITASAAESITAFEAVRAENERSASSWSKLGNAIGEAFGSVLTFLRSSWPEVVPLITSPFPSIVGLATDAFGIRSALISAFSEAATWLYEGGVRIVEGLWAGITTRTEWLYGMVLNFGHRIFDKVKEGLGDLWPFSPSEAGVAVAVGFGLGIQAGQPRAVSAAQGFAAAVSSALRIKVPPIEGFPNGMPSVGRFHALQPVPVPGGFSTSTFSRPVASADLSLNIQQVNITEADPRDIEDHAFAIANLWREQLRSRGFPA